MRRGLTVTQVTLAPYILTDADGSNPRIVFPVSTPAALVLVESKAAGSYVARTPTGDGARIAVVAARAYAQSHRGKLARLYAQMDRIE